MMVDTALQAPSGAVLDELALASVPSGESGASTETADFGPYRVLVLGSALLAKHGVAYHGPALSTAVARRLMHLVDHDVVLVSRFTTRSTLVALDQAIPEGGLAEFDALILCLDQRSSRASTSTFARQVHTLVEELWLRVVPGSMITLVLPPVSITGWSAARSDEFSIELRGRLNALIRVVRLDERHRGGGVELDHARWASEIAEAVAGGLLDPIDVLDSRRAIR